LLDAAEKAFKEAFEGALRATIRPFSNGASGT
jgi:hypothetical protein